MVIIVLYLTSHYCLNSLTHNLRVIFDTNLSFAQHISSISKSCFLNIYDLRRIRINTIDPTTACTIATSLIHSKIDYCNSLQLNLPATQTNRLQLVLNSAARAVTKTLANNLRQVVHHVTPSPISNSPVSNLSTSLFLDMLKTHLFHSSFPPFLT